VHNNRIHAIYLCQEAKDNMAIITKSNFNKILKKVDLAQMSRIDMPIYKKHIYFFNEKEVGLLKGYRELIKDPENFIVEFYKPLKIVDTFKYVIPESEPAYHRRHACKLLNSDFINYEIPMAIRERGVDEVIRFRNWFVKNEHLLLVDIQKFIFRLQASFHYVGEIKPEAIDYSNSGTEEIDNLNLNELEREIDNVLREAGRYYRENPGMQNIIRRFQKFTFLAYISGNIEINDTHLSDIQLKEFLKYYDKNFKVPVKKYLMEYYRIKFNPELDFNGHLLERLGFHMCSECHKVDFDRLLQGLNIKLS